MGWRYTLQRETIPLDRHDLPLVKDGADASLPPTNIATRVGVGDARLDHDALADGPIATLHSSSHRSNMLVPVHHVRSMSVAHTPLPHFFAEGFVSSLIQPPVTLNVTTSLKSCSASSISCKVISCCVPRFHSGLSSVTSTRQSLPTTSGCFSL